MISVKRGDTLQFIVSRKDENGNPLSGEANVLSSQLRNDLGELVGTFVITETATLGDYLFKIESTLTKAFAVGTYAFDIQCNGVDEVYSSETMYVRVLRDVTQDVTA